MMTNVGCSNLILFMYTKKLLLCNHTFVGIFQESKYVLQYNNCNNIVDVEEKNISDIMRSWLNSTILYIQLFNLSEYEPRSILSSLMYSHFSVAKYGRGILLTITNLDSIQQIYSFFEGTPPLD